MRQIKAGIIGISGYTGLELAKILLHHPVFKLGYIANTQGDSTLEKVHTMLDSLPLGNLPIHKANAQEALMCDVLFLALPHKSAMAMTREILTLSKAKNKPIKIIDLSADYRLSAENYEANYCAHTDKENLANAIYGLVEYNRQSIQNATLVANPGCYPTATLLGLLPFVDCLQDSNPVFIDAKSGVSGAGKTLSENTHFSHINENLFAYSPLAHRHQIEIAEKCVTLGKKELDIHFVPHLSPITRGMLVSIFATLKTPLSTKEARGILDSIYGSESFVRVRETPVKMSSVIGSNFCDIFVACKNNGIFINTAIDNLLRGASSQAIVNANIMCGLDEALGIPQIPYGLF